MKTWLSTTLLSFLVACGPAIAQDSANPETRFSGFLGDYSRLQPAPDREGVLLFIDRTGDYRSFRKVMFDPPEVFLAPNPDYHGLQPDTLKRMTDNFVAAFKRALEPEYQVVTEPGPDVLRVRSAITGVQLVKPSMKATDIIPVKALFNIARSAAGGAPMVAEMTAEFEVLDPTGRRIAAATATRKGEKTLKQGQEVTWADLDAITAYWASAFRRRLDEARGVAGR